MNNLLPIGLVFMGGLITTVGDIVMKKWVLDNNSFSFVLGLFVYLIGLIFLAYSFKYKNIAVASIMYIIFNIVTLSIVSWIFFKEKLNAYEIAAMLLGMASIVSLELAGNA